MNYKSIIDVLIWYYPIVIALGLAGNVLAFVVFSQPKLSKTSFGVYFRFLVVSDSITLLGALNDFTIYRFGRALADYSVFMCNALHYLVDSTTCVSATMYVILSVDRLVQVSWPTRLAFLRKHWLQLLVGVSAYVVCFVFDVPEAFVYWQYFYVDTGTGDNATSSNGTLVSLTGKCVWVDPGSIYTWFYMTYVALVPFVIMTTSSVLLTRSVTASKRRVAMANAAGPLNTCSVTSPKRRDIKFAVTLIVLNVCFLCCNMPINILYMLSNYVPVEWDLPNVVLTSLFYTNLMLVFPVNVFLSSMFHEELMKLLAPVLRLAGISSSRFDSTKLGASSTSRTGATR